MRSVTIYPGSANGVVAAPASLSEALPAIVLAAITKTSVRGNGSNPDTISMFNGLFALGAQFRQQGDVVTFYTAPKQSNVQFECTYDVLVLLLPLCAALGGEYTFLGEFNDEITNKIENLDIDWAVDERGVTIKGKMMSRDIELADDTFAVGFMLTLPLNPGAAISCEACKKVLEPTAVMMRKFGFVVSEQNGYTIAEQREVDENYIYSVGADYGKAAYLLLTGFLSGEVGVTGLLADSLQPKKSVIDELKGMKLNLHEMNGAVFAKKSRVSDEVIDVSTTAEPPVALVLACFCKGKCVIKNANLLFGKRREEFDLTAKAMRSIGADIIQIGEEFFITGKKKLFGGNANAHNNQNVALALAAAGLCSEIGVTLSNAPIMSELIGLGVSVQ